MTILSFLQLFREAIKQAVSYKENPTDFTDEIMKELEVSIQDRHYLKPSMISYSSNWQLQPLFLFYCYNISFEKSYKLSNLEQNI